MTQVLTTASPARVTIGIDLGGRSSSYCVLDESGSVLEEGTVETGIEAFEKRFGEYVVARSVIEVCAHARWASKCLERLGHEVVIANPRQFHLISKSTRKTDRNDARMLAQVGRADPGLLRPITLRTDRSAAARVLLNARRHLVATRTNLVNAIRLEAKVLGTRIPRCSAESFFKRASAHLPAPLQSVLRPLIEVLAELQKHINAYDKEVRRLCKQQFPETRLLAQVHGVGPLVALTYAATIDRPERFAHSRKVGAYLGLTPRTYQSGDRNPQLGITRSGDGEMRSLLVGSAAYILRKQSPDCDLKRYGMRIARGGSTRDRARARIAVARKLAVLLHRIWISGEVYNPNCALRQAS